MQGTLNILPQKFIPYCITKTDYGGGIINKLELLVATTISFDTEGMSLAR